MNFVEAKSTYKDTADTIYFLPSGLESWKNKYIHI